MGGGRELRQRRHVLLPHGLRQRCGGRVVIRLQEVGLRVQDERHVLGADLRLLAHFLGGAVYPREFADLRPGLLHPLPDLGRVIDLGVELEELLVVGGRPRVVLQLAMDVSQIVVCLSVVGIRSDGALEGSYRLRQLPLVDVHHAEVVVGDDERGVRVDRAPVGLDGLVEIAAVVEVHALGHQGLGRLAGRRGAGRLILLATFRGPAGQQTVAGGRAVGHCHLRGTSKARMYFIPSSGRVNRLWSGGRAA